MNILIISSRPPQHSAGLGQSIMDCLSIDGNSVDFLTRYPFDEQPSNVFSVFKRSKKELIIDLFEKFRLGFILSIFSKIKNRLLSSNNQYIINNGITIKYPNEAEPEIPIDLILDKITKSYDAIITLFWQDMINTTTLRKIYDKLQCPILIYSPDMAPLTGGCFYFDKCDRYTRECGFCPGFDSKIKNDQSHKNFLIKKDNYKSINCAFMGNTWMNNYARRSNLFKHIIKSEILINENIFKPVNKEISRRKIGIDDKYKFVLMIRSDSHPRKGNLDIKKAIDIFLSNLTSIQKSQCCILVLGDNYYISISGKVACKIYNLGFVNEEKLIGCYQSANYFINASHDDAGPSMINQSIMCGTPVICYNNGSALDVIEDGKSGFKVATGDVNGLAACLNSAYSLDQDNYIELCETTRKLAIQHNSFNIASKNIINTINLLSQEEIVIVN